MTPLGVEQGILLCGIVFRTGHGIAVVLLEGRA